MVYHGYLLITPMKNKRYMASLGRRKQYKPYLLEKVIHATAYDITTIRKVIIIFHYVLGRNVHDDTSMIPSFILCGTCIIVRYIYLKHCNGNRYIYQHCLTFYQQYQSQEIFIDIELVNTQSSLHIQRPTNEKIRALKCFKLMFSATWDTHSLHYSDLDRSETVQHNGGGLQRKRDRLHQHIDFVCGLLNYLHLPRVCFIP